MLKRYPVPALGTLSIIRALRRFSAIFTACLLTGVSSGQSEPNSPQPDSPEKYNLPARAVPDMPVMIPATKKNQSYVPLDRIRAPFYDNIFAVPPPEPPFRLDPSSYRNVTAYEPPQGLLPLHTEPGLVIFHPFAKIIASYDSNIQQTTHQHIADFFVSPHLGADLQIGTPDSVYVPYYETILALNVHYDFWTDLFLRHHEFNAFNNQLNVEGRVGRSDAIWRPFLSAEDITGSNLLSVERLGRIERQRLTEGLRGDYRLTDLVTWSQVFSHEDFQHPLEQYIDYQQERTYQELSYRALQNFDLFSWGEYRYTDPSKGQTGTETIAGLGWRGKPDPRLFSEFQFGWDTIQLHQYEPGRRDLSSPWVGGHTSFEWSDRLRLVVKYDRSYVFNEQTPDDNYMSSTLQFAPEIFLGGNWYITPYIGLSYDEFEGSISKTLQFRPEVEVAYALPDNVTRVFLKTGYERTINMEGPDQSVEAYRVSTGFHWKF